MCDGRLIVLGRDNVLAGTRLIDARARDRDESKRERKRGAREKAKEKGEEGQTAKREEDRREGR